MNSLLKCSLPWLGILRRLLSLGFVPVAQLWVAFALVLAQQALAQSNLPVPKREEDVFRELDVLLPEYPLPASLLRFPTDWTTNSIFLDQKTLLVADDGVVRFALVVRSASGAE